MGRSGRVCHDGAVSYPASNLNNGANNMSEKNWHAIYCDECDAIVAYYDYIDVIHRNIYFPTLYCVDCMEKNDDESN